MSATFYIGPTQVHAGGTLETQDSWDPNRYCRIREGVDVERLQQFAAQNLLVLFYFLNLYQREDQPYLLVWDQRANRIYEGVFFHGIQRQVDGGNIEIQFGFAQHGAPSVSVMLSDIRIVQLFNANAPAYVMQRLRSAPPPRG